MSILCSSLTLTSKAIAVDGSLVVDFGTATSEQMASLKSIEIDGRTSRAGPKSSHGTLIAQP